ncbi:MAG TPA: hypothetical protein VM118_00880 [Acidobacteriota bacterium]|nr:hypothetical protein [Acidobacteriota bacterium]
MKTDDADTVRTHPGLRTGLVFLMPLYLVLLLMLGSCGKEEDPIDRIRMLVPEIAAALNGRDIGGLRRLGTGNLEANRLIIDAFPDGGSGTLTLGFKRIRMLGDSAELTVEARYPADPAAAPRELLLVLKGNGRWRIDSYTFPVPAADTTSAAAHDTT